MTDEDAVQVMHHTIAVYSQRIHQRFHGHLVAWTVEDLEQEGRLAAVLARRTFDPTRAAFRTYARIRIWGAMVDYVRRMLPGTRQALARVVAIADLRGGIDWMPDDRRPCTCTRESQPCAACLAWRTGQRPQGRTVASAAPLEAHKPGATTALCVPLGPLEVQWLHL